MATSRTIQMQVEQTGPVITALTEGAHMQGYRNLSKCLMAAFLVAMVVGCGQEITSVPNVISTIPVAGATNVPINTAISATFSMGMNPSTLTASSFTVTGPGGASVSGAVSYSGTVATFTPAAVLAYNSAYTATITTGAQNLIGTPLRANYVWTFTTITPPPVVVSTVPANGATNVSVAQVLSATFSEAMAPASISGATFTLTGPGGSAVAGTVSYSGVVATLTPTANLVNNAVYTATITTGATSVAGTPLAANYVWTFTTITPPPMVISTIPANAATGVHLSQILSATFNENMKCSTLASPAATFLLTGPGATPVAGTTSCAGAVATFTPAANLAVNTIYTATITTGAQDLAGTPMGANYVWSFRTLPAPTPPTVISTVPVNLATNVPINQALTATFSVAMDSATINSTTFTVAGPGATPVAGVVTYVAAGSVGKFTPAANLLPSTVYTATITTGAQDLAGTALAANYVWTFTTAAVVVVTPPTVVSTIPLNGATNVPLNQQVSATFSVPMDPATIDGNTFHLTGPGNTAVAGLVAYAAIGNTLTFTPTSNLAANTLFTATITTGARDLAGTPLAANYVWTFTTGSAVVVTPPEIVSTMPADLATNVPLTQAISATFSEAMDPLTITTGTFTLTRGATSIPATVSYDAINFVATLTPLAPLTASTTYTALVTNGATDIAGDPLVNTGAPNPWTFTTGAAAVVPPIILGPTITLFGGFGGGAGMTNQGTLTDISGAIGTTGASSLITGFHDDNIVTLGVAECTYTQTPLNQGLVGPPSATGTGNVEIFTAPGTSQPTAACPDEGTSGTPTSTFAIATKAALEAQTAFITLAAIPNGMNVATCPGCGGGNAGELGNRTLAAGIYKSAVGSFSISQGPLTLDAKGDPNAYWVFQMATSLTVGTPASPESVVLVNGAQAGHVFWQVGTAATINYGGGGTFVGTSISSAGSTISSPGVAAITTVDGRILALNASVTMVNTVINVP